MPDIPSKYQVMKPCKYNSDISMYHRNGFHDKKKIIMDDSRGLLLRFLTTYIKSSTVAIVAMIMPPMAAPITAG